MCFTALRKLAAYRHGWKTRSVMQISIQAWSPVVWVGFCMPALLGCTRAAPE
ncbi:conserved hypothetical protein [Xanthomonas oryzae pv. oryzae KACC 10331]|uniref:Uncharacterized protein n=1 Tax=Xanthomonas oryzae pv. oryzae (strain KACC10331 / KXO85) TaxID=291331 RepID=Q5GYV0_XANOR|nr:conserved hypothetical protein [Xanthomonas oryzae pv. oryzae KACC 10331]